MTTVSTETEDGAFVKTDPQILTRLAAIEGQLSLIVATLSKTNARYQWEEKVTETGIQIAGGPTTITKIGLLRGVTALPTPQGLAFAFVLQDETSNKFAILSPELIKPAP